jgi:hypothetical protein
MKILDVPQSGSLAGQTSSRNRYGQYRRTRAIPVNPSSSFQGSVRTRLASLAALYKALTSAQQAGWESLGASIVRVDSLGQSYTLNGFSAYVSVNCVNLAAGDPVVSAAPGMVSPTGLLTATITLSAAAFSIAYTATPLGTGARLFVYASPQRSAGRSFEGDYKLVHVSAAAAASPANVFAAYVARCGTPIVGQRVFLKLQVYLSGFLSGPLDTAATVA